ncbi:MAG: Bax inhibitor-1/YccA family protein [Bacteroidia bacterium]
MNYFDQEGYSNPQAEKQFLASDRASAFMRMVYTTMTLGLALTGLTAWVVSQNAELFTYFNTGIMQWIVMLAPLGFVLALSFGINKMSYSTASIVFAVYSLMMGLSLSYVFHAYAGGNIFTAFFITAGTFGAMSLIGYTTKVDLSKMGSLLYMALIGLIIAMIANLFFNIGIVDTIISVLGVLIFAGLTAWDTQRLLQYGAYAEANDEDMRKVGLIGALGLYLNVVNMFLFILRLLGGDD